MHGFILWIFRAIREITYVIRMICVFLILLLILYWIKNLAGFNWTWMGFIQPFFDCLIEIGDSIYSASLDLLGAVFEFKYFNALIILVLFGYLTKLVDFISILFEEMYTKAYSMSKRNEERTFNRKLQSEIAQAEKKLKKYSVTIKTQLKRKFMHEELNINIDEQNKLMTDFIFSKTTQKPMKYQDAFLYQFDDFDNVDSVFDVLFKLLKSSSPLDYAIAVQIGDDLAKLGKLAQLNHFGKVTAASDTIYRYKYNKGHKYQTAQVGIFQYNNETIEIQEFLEINI